MSEIQLPTRYHLKSPVSGRTFKDENWILAAENEPEPSLLISVYEKKQLDLLDGGDKK